MGEEPAKTDKKLELKLDALDAHDQVQKARETRKRARDLHTAANDQVQRAKEVYNKLKKRYDERHGPGLPDFEDEN